MKARRQAEILAIIQEYDIETQDQLLEKLREKGMFAVSSSANLTQLGPIMVARRKSRSNNGLDAVEVGCMWKLLCKKVSLPYIGNGCFCGPPSRFSNEKAPQAWACGAVRHACRMEARIL